MKWILQKNAPQINCRANLDSRTDSQYTMYMTQTYDTQTGIELLYRGVGLQQSMFDSDVVELYNAACEQLELELITDHIEHSLDFVIPEYYKELDVTEYVYQALKHKHDNPTAETLQRVEFELELFEAKNLFPVLQMLIYIVDTMKRNNIVWGVGRGSSVASYCLYLLEVHRIDSIKYNLDIREFLR